MISGRKAGVASHRVVLDELGDRARQVGASPQQIGGHPAVLTLMMRGERGAERQATSEDDR